MRRSAKGFPRAGRGRAYGVGVTNSSGARVGITDATTPAGNLIENNGLDGINLSNGSNANLHGNTIQGNGRDGVNVGRSSLRLIGANTIRANTVRGVTVSQGGGGVFRGAGGFSLPAAGGGPGRTGDAGVGGFHAGRPAAGRGWSGRNGP